MNISRPPILGLALLLFPASASAQAVVQKLLASDGQGNDLFGRSVAVHGTRAIVGQTGLDYLDHESAYAFRRVSSGWTQVQRFTSSDAASSDWFGYACAMLEETAFVGATAHDHGGVANSGAVYVFQLAQGGWQEIQELRPPSPQAHEGFGSSIAVDGEVLVVSAWGHDAPGMRNSGIAYVFERGAQGWSYAAELQPADVQATDQFGNEVAVSGTRIAVGEARDSGYLGAVYVFEKTVAGWIETAKLTASDGEAYDQLGWSVDLEGDHVLAGTPGVDGSGAAYVFERTPSGWVEREKLSPPDPQYGIHFGYEVALEGAHAFVAAPFGVSDAISGSVYAYRRAGDSWPFLAKISPPDEAPPNAFGVFLAAEGETLFAGTPWDDDLGHLSGSAYFVDVPRSATPYGYCANAGPCSNDDPAGGCANSTSRGARLAARGSGSVASGDFALAAHDLPPHRRVTFYRGGAEARAPLGDGIRHVGAGSFGLFRYPPLFSASDGTVELGPGLLAGSGIAPGETWYFQARYADPDGPCGTGSNATNALRAVFGP